MDQVLTDFIKSAENIYSNIFNIPEIDMWKIISQYGKEFWINLEWMPDGKLLWNYIKQFNVKILTSLPVGKPMNDFAKQGKLIWVKNNLEEKYLKNIIFTTTNEKYKYSNSNSILIDDYIKIITKWNQKGGIGIQHIDSKQTIKLLKRCQHAYSSS